MSDYQSIGGLVQDLKGKINSFLGFFELDEVFESREIFSLSLVLLFYLLVFLERFKDIHEFGYGPYVCQPIFQNCEYLRNLIFNFTNINYFHGFLIFFGTSLFLSIYFLFKKWKKAFAASFLLNYFIFLLIYIFYGYVNFAFRFPTIVIFFAFSILIFSPRNRINFLRLFFVMFYFLSSITKLNNPFWILGYLPLPFIPQTSAIYLENAFIVLQMILPFLLLINNNRLRLGLAIFLEGFHLYTFANVGIDFSFWTTPFIYLLFIESKENFELPSIKENLITYSILAYIIILNFIRLIIPGNDYFTMEGSNLGFNMFQHTAKCAVSYDEDGKPIQRHMFGLYTCDPYLLYMKRKEYCKDHDKADLRVYTDDGYFTNKLIDEENVCVLKYSAFSRNYWIRDNPVLKDSVKMSKAQIFVFERYNYFNLFYQVLFFTVIVVILFCIFIF